MAKLKIAEIKKSILEVMQKKGIVITSYSLDLIEKYCEHIEIVNALRKSIKKDGVTIYNDAGKPLKNENINVMNNTFKQALVLLSKLGVEPSEIRNVEGEDL